MPSCEDGIDNDQDGMIDFPDDNGCSAAADDDERPTCESDIAIFPNSETVEGTTVRSLAETQGACGFDAGSPESIWRLRVPYPGLVNADTLGSPFNTILTLAPNANQRRPALNRNRSQNRPMLARPWTQLTQAPPWIH